MKLVLVKDEKLKEMSNLLKKDTGLSHDLWLDDAGSTRKIGHHEPRLKVKVEGGVRKNEKRYDR